MHIVGIEAEEGEDAGIHTIDVWYSQKRRAWVVERLDAEGTRLGVCHASGSREDAIDCMAAWLRAHPEAHLTSPVPDAAAETLVRSAARRALLDGAKLAS